MREKYKYAGAGEVQVCGCRKGTGGWVQEMQRVQVHKGQRSAGAGQVPACRCRKGTGVQIPGKYIYARSEQLNVRVCRCKKGTGGQVQESYMCRRVAGNVQGQEKYTCWCAGAGKVHVQVRCRWEGTGKTRVVRWRRGAGGQVHYRCRLAGT